jgi:putative drug exporter of the RND superfamily
VNRDQELVADHARRRRLRRAMLMCAAVVLLAPFSYRVESGLETAAHIKGSQTELVSQELASQFQSPFVHRVVLVMQGLPSPESDEGRRVLTKLTTEVQRAPGVSGVFSYLDWTDPIFLGNGGGTFIIIGLAPGDSPVESLIPDLRERIAGLRDEVQRHYPAVKLEITGETPLNFDLRKTSADEVGSAERLVLPLTLLLLLVAFRSVVAALLPLGVGLLAICMTLGASALLAKYWHLSILIQNLASMLGLGLGVDYALLMVSEFRENLAAGCNPSEAADRSARLGGHTLIVSASTVAIGFAALLTVPISDIRSIGVAGLLVAAASVLLANLLLPALLAWIGNRIDIGRPDFRRKISGNLSAWAPDRWRRWANKVTENSWLALLAAGVPLLLLGSQVARLDMALPRGNWLPPQSESVRALSSLQEMKSAGIVQSLRLILEFPAGFNLQSDSGWDALSRMSTQMASDNRAGRVISLSTLAGDRDRINFFRFLPEATLKSFLRSDGRATLIEILPASTVSSAEQIRWVRELRQANAAELTGMPGATIRVGGIPALNADYDSVVREHLPPVIALVVGGTSLALLLGFRSLFVAVKATALNLLSVAASLGLLVLVFQDGHGSRFLGVSGATGSVFPIVPILAFAIVFGLSMDYEVFLVARVLEARLRGLSESDAIADGLARTGGLITSAAAIMVVVFAAFTLGGFLVIKMLGFTLTVAVAIDATLVRMVIGPALLHVAGDWNWWPWGLRGAVIAPTDKSSR